MESSFWMPMTAVITRQPKVTEEEAEQERKKHDHTPWGCGWTGWLLYVTEDSLRYLGYEGDYVTLQITIIYAWTHVLTDRKIFLLLLFRHCHIWLFVAPWTVVCKSPLPMGFPRQEYWSGLPFSSPGYLLDLGTKPTAPALQADSLPLSHLGKPRKILVHNIYVISLQLRKGWELGYSDHERRKIKEKV